MVHMTILGLVVSPLEIIQGAFNSHWVWLNRVSREGGKNSKCNLHRHGFIPYQGEVLFTSQLYNNYIRMSSVLIKDY